MTLGNHLGADQDVGGLILKTLQDVYNRVLPHGGISIHPGHLSFGKQRLDSRLDFLGTKPQLSDFVSTAT